MYCGYTSATLTLRVKGSFYTHLSPFNERAESCNHCCTVDCAPIYGLPVHPKSLYGYCIRQSALIHWSPSRAVLSGYSRLAIQDRLFGGCRAPSRARDPYGSYREVIGLLADIDGCYRETAGICRARERSESRCSGRKLWGDVEINGDRRGSSRREGVYSRSRRDGSSSSYHSASSSSFSGGAEAKVDRPARTAGERSDGYSRNGHKFNRVDDAERVVREVCKYEDAGRGLRKGYEFQESGTGARASSSSKASEWRARGREEKDASLVDRAHETRERNVQEERRLVRPRYPMEGSQNFKIISEVREDDARRVSGLTNKGSSSASAVELHSETDRQAVGSSELRKSSLKLKEIDEVHGSDSKWASDSQRNFEETRLEDHVDTSTSVQNAFLARDKRSRMEQHTVDKIELNQQFENYTDVSRIHSSDAENKTTSQILLEKRTNAQEHHSASAMNLVHRASEQQSQTDERVNRQYSSRRASEKDTKLSELSRGEVERVSNSQEISNMRTKGEDHSTSVVNLVHRTAEQHNQTSNPVDYQYSSRRASERDTRFSESSSSEVERPSSSQGISITRIGNQRESSSSMLLQDKNNKQSSTLVGQSLQLKNAQVASTGILDAGSSSLHQNVYELDNQTNIDATYQFKDNRIESASRLDKSSALYVGEFVDKLRQEISYSDALENASKHYSEIQVEEARGGTSQTVTDVHLNVRDSSASYKDEKYAQESVRQSSSRSGMKGPSAEMWDVRGLHSQEPSRTEEPKVDPTPVGVADSTNVPARTENSIAQRSHRSLWTYVADIIRMGWGLRAKSQNLALKSGTRSSSNESVSSEAWFSGHDENDDDIDRKSGSGTPKETVQFKRPIDPSHLRAHSAPSQVSSEASGPGDRITLSEASSSPSRGSTKRASLSKGSSLVSKQPEDLQRSKGEMERRGVHSTVVTIDQLSAPTVGTVSPATEDETTEIGNVLAPGRGFPMLEVQEEPPEENLPEAGGDEGKDGELKRRKLQRNKQVLKERFDEWEDAYKRESEQRKIDEFFMREALLEAKKAADTWEVPVGAVLVQNGKIIARGCNLVEELRDSTAHAEMICIREASNILRTWRLAETTLYVTLEPCAMCAGAILQARIDTVVWGAPNKLLGADGSWVRLFPGGDGGSNSLEPSSQTSGPVHPFHPKMTIRRGILAPECSDAMQHFFQLRRKKKKPESPPPSCLPISNQPTNLFTKVHDIFCIMFCL